MQCGWWRVTDQRLLKDLTKTLHQRGIREKSLQKNILKFNDYTHHSFEKQEYQCKCYNVFILLLCIDVIHKSIDVYVFKHAIFDSPHQFDKYAFLTLHVFSSLLTFQRRFQIDAFSMNTSSVAIFERISAGGGQKPVENVFKRISVDMQD